jgi:hypothetical protein
VQQVFRPEVFRPEVFRTGLDILLADAFVWPSVSGSAGAAACGPAVVVPVLPAEARAEVLTNPLASAVIEGEGVEVIIPLADAFAWKRADVSIALLVYNGCSAAPRSALLPSKRVEQLTGQGASSTGPFGTTGRSARAAGSGSIRPADSGRGG